jgi:hypothetical protein
VCTLRLVQLQPAKPLLMPCRFVVQRE